ncbi:uncharacterized protein Z519_07513 [Cladophialophora bantiana CBS 173.52]|uniref:Exonuclease domain-containing protein n=1 Tax=Cladophialophora bantiana (strain ATCC 10958 / CBS 173.52 / CDC B-1940 / NIH 8579) TaxID=1442370 RepID=A0A0D2FYN4_CLAB1|nr:uncharacterized protein Z519_07513 [Cladophialophora bantiana CBS 173.52]KIW91547.1 hypothetical protein Z519_07513 [Cladophialophora bantiana CBS 173.52]
MAQPKPPAWPLIKATEPNVPHVTWSNITFSPAYVEKLRLVCHSQKELKKAGYVLQPLDSAQITSKARCTKCGKRQNRRARPKPVRTDAGNDNKGQKDLMSVDTENAVPSETEHSMPPPDDPQLHEHWQYHYTPPIPAQVAPTTSTASRPTPPVGSRRRGHRRGGRQSWQPFIVDYSTRSHSHSHSHNHQQQQHKIPRHLHAIALDCEMGTSAAGHPELIRLTVVDFFSGAVLIDNLVSPSVRMAHYNTRYSGVTARDMRQALARGTAILGCDRAREALFRHCGVGPDTVVVVHGGASDFTALRWIHPLIVDTCILERYTYSGVSSTKTPGGRSLQNLCKLKLGIPVQVGKRGHDSFEDAMAARELFVHWAKGIPDV